MRILYLSCHETLERDELCVLDKLGHQVFSLGHYMDPRNPLHPTRDGILPIKFDPELLEQFQKYHNYKSRVEQFDTLNINTIFSTYTKRVKKQFVDLFDLVIITHFEDNLTLNWDSIKHKPIILRYIGQPETHYSPYVKHVKKIAYSPTEKYISRHKKFDAIIRPYVDTDYFNGWTGAGDYVLTINKWMKKRGNWSAWNTYLEVTSGMNRVVGGFENEDIPFSAGDLKPDDINKLRQEAKVYFSTCTKPGPFTYSFIEALSTGIPMVTVGPEIGSISKESPTFEAHTFVENGVSGFWSDDVKQLKDYIRMLLNDEKLAKTISEGGRQSAIKHFSMERNMQDWANILQTI